jgi:hypothetical protein
VKHLNDKAEAIFRKLTEGMVKVGDHQQWNNNSSFMAACIEIIGRTGLGPLVSIAHYYVQEGDMMRDPDVVFLVGADQHVYPISYRQDGLGIDQEAAVVEDGQWKVRTKMQADIAKFCNEWMRNIEQQQFPREKQASESRTWKCPECGHVETIDQDWLADHGEPVCGKCLDVDMELQPKGYKNV